ncbi:uncharacterized protein LOC130656038 [Hydractinia symbiolongicarpus]|uniref:uncharacterized protein LOC130656038 n=1 Tax=Hydractinia symbiolongicarpus TaxID=13093 RepID=UPI00254A4464|nr:uncharacterized protein LOC130656038 [Hydractinia symbiolongicarpus]
MAVCNAAGKVLDPFIIFQGKNFQSTWRGENGLPNTFYAVTPNGWMNTITFADWFDKFSDQNAARPMLLFYDGHMSHISIPVIQKALDQNILLLKFPPHVTDILQPLDKCCFGPLKRSWENLLNERINRFGLVKKVDKPEFVNLLATVWHEGMNEGNVKAGFESTGIWPLNREKYDTSRFDVRLVHRYDEWVASGKPSLDWTTCNSGKDAPKAVKKPLTDSNVEFTVDNTSTETKISTPKASGSKMCSNNTPTKIHSSAKHFSKQVMDTIGPFPFDAPLGFQWVPNGWKLEPVSSTPTPTTAPIVNKSFEELFLNKIKPMEKPGVKKRRKINLAATVVSDAELLQEIINKESEKKNSKKKSKVA